MPRRFCYSCGKITNELYDGLCADCFIKMHSMFKMKRIPELTICYNCFGYFYRGKWHYSTTKDTINNLLRGLEDSVLDSFEVAPNSIVEKIEISIIDFNRLLMKKRKIKVLLRVKGKPHKLMKKSYVVEKELSFRLNWTLCPACRRVKGQVERAILQIRVLGRKLTDSEKKRIMKLIEEEISRLYERDKEAVILEKDEKEGIDIHLSSKRVARMLANMLRRKFIAKTLETSKVIGVDSSGKVVTKSTVRVLLALINVGDVVVFRGKPLLVTDVVSGNVIALSLDTYKKVKLSPNDVFSKDFSIVDRGVMKKACIISITPPYVQLMDLKDYSVFEIQMEKFPSWVKEGENVLIFTLNEKTYLIPQKICIR